MELVKAWVWKCPRCSRCIPHVDGDSIGGRECPSCGRPHQTRFNGPAEDESREGRLNAQHERIRDLMQDGRWRTLPQIESATGYPQASISAQLRHLRKARFGGWDVDKQHLDSGLWEYRLVQPFGLEG